MEGQVGTFGRKVPGAGTPKGHEQRIRMIEGRSKHPWARARLWTEGRNEGRRGKQRVDTLHSRRCLAPPPFSRLFLFFPPLSALPLATAFGVSQSCSSGMVVLGICFSRPDTQSRWFVVLFFFFDYLFFSCCCFPSTEMDGTGKSSSKCTSTTVTWLGVGLEGGSWGS